MCLCDGVVRLDFDERLDCEEALEIHLLLFFSFNNLSREALYCIIAQFELYFCATFQFLNVEEPLTQRRESVGIC